MAGRRTGGLGKGLDALIPNKAGGQRNLQKRQDLQL